MENTNNNVESMAQKYASQIESSVRKDKTLAFYDGLKAITEADNQPFLELLSRRSIFFVSLLDKTKKKSLGANIPMEDFNTIVDNTEVAKAKLREAPDKKATPSEAVADNPAFTVVLTMGKFKGRSAGDLILDSKTPDETIKELSAHADFLSQNVDKYPRNQVQIDAIKSAIGNYAIDELKRPEGTSTAQTGGIYDIYSSPVKPWNGTKKGEIYKCYSLKVMFDASRDYPITIQVMNCFAPKVHTQNGLEPVNMEKATEVEKWNFTMGMNEWASIVMKLAEFRTRFKDMIFEDMYKADKALRWQNKQ